MTGTGAVNARGRSVEASYALAKLPQGATVTPDKTPGWLHTDIGSRAEAETLLRAQPVALGTMYYLVRPRPGPERSFAISSVANGKLAHMKLEQPTAGGSWVANGKPVRSGKRITDATTAVVEQLGRLAGCATVVPVLVGPTFDSDC